ncbi:MAG TPA: hypothetical protein VGM23_07850, partial [Armatimonadota bacterium]
ITWGDGRPYVTPVKKDGPLPQGFKAEYEVTIQTAGWYELLLNGVYDFAHDLFVDGVNIYRYGNFDTSSDGDRLDKESAKAVNLYLTAGKHTLRLQRVGRVGFPMRIFTSFLLRPAENAQGCIFARKDGNDVLRVGETLRLKVTGGGLGAPVSYTLVREDQQTREHANAVVGKVDFPAGNTPVTKVVELPCTTEGVYRLRAMVNGQVLRPNDLHVGNFAVVDVQHTPLTSARMVPVHDIDCAAQTDNGKPLAPGTFTECNGATRVGKSAAGSYRESNDCTGPGVEDSKGSTALPRSYSGFSYKLPLPDPKGIYLVEVLYPNDDRRSVTMPVYTPSDVDGDILGGYSGKAYETGGMFPLTNTMLTHKMVIWASSHTMVVGLLSQQIGQRAAAARVRISRFEGELPATPATQRTGRTFAHWYEEGDNIRFVVNSAGLYKEQPEIVADFTTLKRWVQLARYSGMNGISGMGVSYQGAFYRADALEGFMPKDYDEMRLAALLCEKYGMRYIPEVFPNMSYLNKRALEEDMLASGKAKDLEELRPMSRQGLSGGPDYAACDKNALHPAVQQYWINALGEMADKLRDSPAFAGITVRADSWFCPGYFYLPSLNWGYSQWMMDQFTKETGIAVPIANDDPERYEKRYAFLTSPTMRDRWIRWRCDRVMDYQRRLRDRIRGNRKDLFFGIVGSGVTDSSYELPDDLAGRFLGMGIDTERIKHEDGIAVIPTANYGTRNTTVSEQAMYDDFLDPATVNAGAGYLRAFAAYMTYHELGTAMPYDKLGIQAKNPPYYCSPVDAGGRASLEKFADVLAEQDSTLLRDGGNSYIFGDPAIWEPWAAEFRALPALPFTPVEIARDPVAVWYRDVKAADAPGMPAGCYWYAVNREQYPVTITLSLTNPGALMALGSGKETALSNGTLVLKLQPYELRSFRMAAGARIADARTEIPADRLDFLKYRLAFAQNLAQQITTGMRKNDVTDIERDGYLQNLSIAWEAFAQKHYWRARTALAMASMMQVYVKLAALPEGQVVTRFSDKLTEKTGRFYTLAEPVIHAKDLAPASTAIVLSNTLNPDWGGESVLMATDGKLDFTLDVPADGCYALSIGQVAPTHGVTTVSINGESLAMPIITNTPNAPETMAFPLVNVKTGKVRVTLERKGAFGVYGVKWLPALRPLVGSQWSTVGPFSSLWGGGPGREGYDNSSAVKRGFAIVFPPEKNLDLSAVYRDGDQEWHWTQVPADPSAVLRPLDTSNATIKNKIGVDFVKRTKSVSMDFNFAVTYLNSPDDRAVLLYLGVDWWANAYLNGELVKSTMSREVAEREGCEFNTMNYT